MLAPRGWWFLAIVFTVLLVAVALSVATLAVTALTLLIWFLAAWVQFLWQTRRVPQTIEIDREIVTANGPTAVLWARQSATVRVRIRCSRGPGLPFVLAIDKVPSLADVSNGDPWGRGPMRSDEPLEFEYPILCPAAGRLRFDGVKLIVADLQGFFHRTVFVRRPVRVRVLPPLVVGPRSLPSKKRHNLIPLAGHHRLVRPGGGSELLDLRDYVPSDPPKLIAWKPSARRDKLITKELESEVPIRCTLFVDASTATRVGPVGRNPLARLVEIASGVLYANAEARDLTGLVVFDDHGPLRILRPGRGRRAFFERLNLLADVADSPPTIERREVRCLVPLVLGLAQDVVPDWLTPDMNATPWYSPRFWWRDNRWRKMTSAVLANVYRLGAGGVTLLYHDDEAFCRFAERWLNEHRVAAPVMLFDDDGRYLFPAEPKIRVLARSLTEAVVRAKDNELFVLLVDLLGDRSDLAPLLKAVKMARARHHDVQVICPWPPGVPLPDAQDRPPAIFLSPNLQELLSRVWTSRLHQALGDVRRDFGRVGAVALAAPDERTVPQILERLQRLRAGGRR